MLLRRRVQANVTGGGSICRNSGSQSFVRRQGRTTISEAEKKKFVSGASEIFLHTRVDGP